MGGTAARGTMRSHKRAYRFVMHGTRGGCAQSIEAARRPGRAPSAATRSVTQPSATTGKRPHVVRGLGELHLPVHRESEYAGGLIASGGPPAP